MDFKVEQLRNFREALAAHDRSLVQSLKKTTELGIQGQIPLRTLFERIRQEFPDLVPKFEVYGQIPVVKQQVVHAIAMLDGKIRGLESELEEYEQRNQLSSDIHHTRHLLAERIAKGDSLRINYESILRSGFSAVTSWRAGTRQTLKNVFVSPWNSSEFERIAKAAENSTSAPDASLFVLEDCIRFLHSLDEQLYLEEGRHVAASVPAGTKVFIGHGRSAVWRELRDFVRDKLHLKCDEYNAIPAAGIFTPERVKEMLDNATFAFLVLTAEDEQLDGSVRARENVVHEAGLFQGRLGFRKAIIVLEQGCQPFSNIEGLTRLEFPKGNIRSMFQDARETLEREGLLSAER
jgi:hypothetical protein